MYKRFLAGVFFFSLLAPVALAADFSDVPNTNGHYIPVNYYAAQKVLKGYGENVFKPDQPVNRAEALKILLLATKIEVPSQSKTSFKDVKSSDWFAPYVFQAKNLKFVEGNADGTFAPQRNVTRAEFMKMMLMANGFKTDKWIGKSLFKDVPKDQWFTPHMNYAGQAGILVKDANNKIFPNQHLTRGEVADVLYLMMVIRSGKDSKFLLSQAQAQMAQVDAYLNHADLKTAKRTSELAVDMTQQALKNLPENKTVLSTAKLARAYDFVVSASVLNAQKKFDESKNLLDQAVTKATEAWAADHDSQPLARHIKDKAREILVTIPGVKIEDTQSVQPDAQSTSSSSLPVSM